MNTVDAADRPPHAARLRILHPVARSVAGTLAVAVVACAGYALFVHFSDATALQRAAGPQGSHLGADGRELVLARTGRNWRDRELARRAAASAPLLAITGDAIAGKR